MIELDAIRVAEDEVLAMRRRGQRLRVRLRLPLQEMPHFVLLPDRFMLRWEHLDDGGLPVHLRSWSCRVCGSSVPGLVLIDLRLRLEHAAPDGYGG